MKTRQWLMAAVCSLLLPLAGASQCSNTIMTMSHETTVSGTGSMVPPFNFSFPMFDGGLGTLMEVRFKAVVTLSYSFSIENKSTSPGLSMVGINRYDAVSSPVLSSPITSNYTSAPQIFMLGATDGIPGSGPDFQQPQPIYILDHDTVLNSVLNVADFIGDNPISFEYTSVVYSMLGGNVNVDLGGQAHDEMKFIVSYTYCSPIVLTPDITSFTATKKNSDIDLRWSTPNEAGGRHYEVEKSIDGQSFITIGQLPSAPGINGTGSYLHTYIPATGEKGKLTFRIKVKDSNGGIQYTQIRIVDIGSNPTGNLIRLFPNPSRGGETTLIFHNAAQGDWNVEVFNTSGQLIGRNQFKNSLSAKLNTGQKLSTGIYIVRATNTITQERFVERLVVK